MTRHLRWKLNQLKENLTCIFNMNKMLITFSYMLINSEKTHLSINYSDYVNMFLSLLITYFVISVIIPVSFKVINIPTVLILSLIYN